MNQGPTSTGRGLAGEHLRRRGYEILACGHMTPHGELDIVASDSRRIVFASVVTTVAGAECPRGAPHPSPACREATRRMGAAWLAEADRPEQSALRFETLIVTVDSAGRLVSLEHVEAAF